ncbi:hypothetical protein [Actinoplanes sp. NPDC049599]|uniref:hypothetical protein n=1 Tax=Actinoplanes sp. NPDC049599 TaxID=3363903 RepID=UPI003794AB01
MSSIIRFFVAPDDEAAATVVDGDPENTFESVTYGNFDADLALLEWDSLLTGRAFDDLLLASASGVITDEDDGALIVAASPELQEALAAASEAELERVARLWADERAAEGETVDPELAHEILTELARLSRTTEHRLYCRVS